MNVLNIDYSEIPEHMVDGIKLYLEHGVLPGSFLVAVLCNDLVGACSKADRINKEFIFEWARFLYCHVSKNCWGSPEIVHKYAASFDKNRQVKE